jgi:hypothetical protein
LLRRARADGIELSIVWKEGLASGLLVDLTRPALLWSLKMDAVVGPAGAVYVLIDFEVTVQQEGHNIPSEMAMCAFSLDRGIFETFHCFIKPGNLPQHVLRDRQTRFLEKNITGINPKGGPGARGDYMALLLEVEEFLRRVRAVGLYAKDSRMEDECLAWIVGRAGLKASASPLLERPVSEYHDLCSLIIGSPLERATTEELFRLVSVNATQAQCRFHSERNSTVSVSISVMRRFSLCTCRGVTHLLKVSVLCTSTTQLFQNDWLPRQQEPKRALSLAIDCSLTPPMHIDLQVKPGLPPAGRTASGRKRKPMGPGFFHCALKVQCCQRVNRPVLCRHCNVY